MEDRPLLQTLPAKSTPLTGTSRVLRALPRRERRRVGPFVFLDHFGPEAPSMRVPPHPHVGLATVSYLYAGRVQHRDSIGSAQTLSAGGVNWMTAGAGIVHEEIAVAEGGELHGLQLWVALPLGHRATSPRFQHVAASALPVVAGEGFTARVVAGAVNEARSPIVTFEATTMVDVTMEAGASVARPVPADHEIAIYVASGAIDVRGARLDATSLGVLGDGDRVSMKATAAARVMVIGGAPSEDATVLWWNFVTESVELGKALEARWKSGGFPALEASP